MKFMMTWSWTPNQKNRDEGISRFLKTGGLPPKGARLLGRWTRADLSGGFELIETDQPKLLAEFSLMWSDLMELALVPVLEDEDTADVLKRGSK